MWQRHDFSSLSTTWDSPWPIFGGLALLMIVSFIAVGLLFPSNNDCPLTMKFVDRDVIVDEI